MLMMKNHMLAQVGAIVLVMLPSSQNYKHIKKIHDSSHNHIVFMLLWFFTASGAS